MGCCGGCHGVLVLSHSLTHTHSHTLSHISTIAAALSSEFSGETGTVSEEEKLSSTSVSDYHDAEGDASIPRTFPTHGQVLL